MTEVGAAAWATIRGPGPRWVWIAVVVLTACGDGGACGEAPEEPPPARATEAPAPAAAVTAPRPEPLPPFDFRRLVLDPERYRHSTRTCRVQRLGQLRVDNDGVDRRSIRCANRAGGYEVDVFFEESIAERDLAPPASTPPTERWLSLVADGISDDGARGRAVYASSRLMPAPVAAVPERPPGPRRAGLDFSRVATEPGLIGSRQSCAVRAATVIVRRSGDAVELPPEVVVTMPVTCAHEAGRSNAELAFTADTAAHALLVGAGAMAHGIVESSRRLRVTHVTPPDG